VDPWRRDQGGEAGAQLVGGEQEEEGAAAGALHPVDEAAVLSRRKPIRQVEGDRSWRLAGGGPDGWASELWMGKGESNAVEIVPG
jgi:hypothetical protein